MHARPGHRLPTPPPLAIARLRAAIDTVDAQMAGLMHERSSLETSLERAVRLQSPVNRLPSELLAADDDPAMLSALMLVCRYWAQLAIATPCLWSTITVSAHESLERVRRRLERSKACPLDVSICFEQRAELASICSPEQHKHRVMDHVVRAMDLIRPALWRTQRFRLAVPTRAHAHAALARCREDAPLLEALAVEIGEPAHDEPSLTASLPLFNGHTPRLRACALASFNCSWQPTLLSNLRVLALGGYFNGAAPDPATLLGVLRACPELEELALRNVHDPEEALGRSLSFCGIPTSTTPAATASRGLALPNLRRLSLYSVGSTLVAALAAALVLPALEAVELCYLQDVGPLVQLLHQQSLTRLPLRALRLVDIDDLSPAFLKGLSASQPPVCPRLETLSLEACTTVDWDAIRTFVELRSGANPTAGAGVRSQSHDRVRSAPMSASVFAAGAAPAYVPTGYSSASAAAAAPKTPSVSSASGYSSASASAAVHATQRTRAQTTPPRYAARLHAIDVRRCSQISREMVQWLRMYVPEVRYESSAGGGAWRGAWAEREV
ncbi:hypothetical protein BD626DRAFT_547837 [Schizophyllum amplum]|uniref:Uncharacterized protein n=1 Tax=Schizophyllum amplum TaxID=97359 RepID=A0A550CHE3_9AGAR|nr:hypothetical protein BD626DRAFT_547837 [Auriculariopsis ampla]